METEDKTILCDCGELPATAFELHCAKCSAVSECSARFFQLLVHDAFTGERTGWYWQDDGCEEPMGPFPSYREAALDHREMRPFSSVSPSLEK